MAIAYSILDVGFPSLCHAPQVKKLDVSVIIPRTHTPLTVTVGIAKGHAPAIPPRLPLGWLHASHRVTLLPGVPHLDTSWKAEFKTLSTTGKYYLFPMWAVLSTACNVPPSKMLLNGLIVLGNHPHFVVIVMQ